MARSYRHGYGGHEHHPAAERLRERAEIFRSATKTRKAIHQTFVTTYGLKKNMYSGTIQSEVVLDDLFIE